MPGPTVNLLPVQTGGAAILQMPDYFSPAASGITSISISRAVSGSILNWGTLYAGEPMAVYVDVGDNLQEPLDPNTAYFWQVIDSTGTTEVGPLTPSSAFVTYPDQLSQILIRLLQGAMNSLTLPDDVERCQITTKMPQNGFQAMPFMVVNLDLIQQTEVQIGEDVPNPSQNGNWTIFANAKRVWRISILSRNADERDYYRDTLTAVFRVLLATAFTPMGLNVSHSFQAASYTDANEWDGKVPGFYGADLMMEINGIFPAAIVYNYGLIERIDAFPTYLGVTDEISVPLDPG